jgi:hypothetical protein
MRPCGREARLAAGCAWGRRRRWLPTLADAHADVKVEHTDAAGAAELVKHCIGKERRKEEEEKAGRKLDVLTGFSAQIAGQEDRGGGGEIRAEKRGER